jgi:hypothetical protein
MIKNDITSKYLWLWSMDKWVKCGYLLFGTPVIKRRLPSNYRIQIVGDPDVEH